MVVVVRVVLWHDNAYALPNAAERNKSFCASVSISYLEACIQQMTAEAISPSKEHSNSSHRASPWLNAVHASTNRAAGANDPGVNMSSVCSGTLCSNSVVEGKGWEGV